MDKNFTASQVSAFRLKRHNLSEKGEENLIQIAGNVCGIQAQVLNSAYTAFRARMNNISKDEISSALYIKRTLARTMVMRQTVHIIPSFDFYVYINAVKNRNMDGMLRIMSTFGIKYKDVEKLNLVILDALADGPLTKGELSKAIILSAKKNMQDWMGRVGNPFKSAIFEGLVCYAQNKGSEAIFVRVDQWLPNLKQISDEKAKQSLFLNYFKSYGPAALVDFSKWSGNLATESESIMRSVRDGFHEVNYDGKKGFILKEDLNELASVKLPKNTLQLLPSFDSFLLGHARKDHLLDLKHYKKVYKNQWWISPVVLLDGQIIGIWSHKKKSKSYLIEIELFDRYTKSIINKIEKEIERLERFWELPCEIKFNI
jgi:hypothetical protein